MISPVVWLPLGVEPSFLRTSALIPRTTPTLTYPGNYSIYQSLQNTMPTDFIQAFIRPTCHIRPCFKMTDIICPQSSMGAPPWTSLPYCPRNPESSTPTTVTWKKHMLRSLIKICSVCSPFLCSFIHRIHLAILLFTQAVVLDKYLYWTLM